MPRWMYSFGAFHFGAAPMDSLQLLFVTAVLGTTPAITGLVDAIGYLGTIVTSLMLAVWLRPTGNIARLFVWTVAGMGVAMICFALVQSTLLAILLAFVIGLLQGPPSVVAPLLAAEHVRAQLDNPFTHLSRASSLGAGIGVALSALWLVMAVDMVTQGMALRLLFAGLGGIAIAGAWWAQITLRAPKPVRRLAQTGQPPAEPPVDATSLLAQLSWSEKAVATAARSVRAPLLTDALFFYLAATTLLAVGVGMSFTAIHSFTASELGAPLSLLMVAILAMRFIGFYISGPAGRGRPSLLAFQSQGVAAMMRAVSIALLGVVALVLDGPAAIAGVLLLVALWGMSLGIFNVMGAQITADLAMPGRWRQSQALFTTLTNVGALLGALFGGYIAGVLGFGPMFLIAAACTAVAALLLLRS